MASKAAAAGTASRRRKGLWGTIEDELALRSLISEYLIPEETNNIWYTLGGVLFNALGFEVLTGFLLMFPYQPDAGKAYDITSGLMRMPVWSVIINFHFWAAYVIFGLAMLHMVRVFVTGGYRLGKQGLAWRRAPRRQPVRRVHHRRDSALGRGGLRGPVARLGILPGARPRCRLQLHLRAAQGRRASLREACPDLWRARIDGADHRGGSCDAPLLPGEGEGHLSAVLAEAQRTEGPLQLPHP